MGELTSEMANKSFKMHRNSPLASKLKSSISGKLVDFFDNYDDDDVLAEYMTVLVCNGKNQNQAKEDLDAFLGKRSAEFVTWLWDLLSKYAPQYDMTTGLSISKDVRVTNSHDSDADKDQRTNMLREPQDHGTENDSSSLVKVEKFNEQSTDAYNHRRSNDMEIVEGIHQRPGFSASELNIKELTTLPCKRKFPRELGPNGDTYDGFETYISPVMRDYSMNQPGESQSLQCLGSSKVVNIRCNGLPNQLLSLPKREPHFRGKPSSPSDIPRPRQSFAVKVSRRSLSPRAVDAASQQTDKSRRSVWDRLGKPGGNTFGKVNAVHAHDVDQKNEEVLDEHTLLVPLPSDECKRSTIEARRFGKRVLDERPLLEHTASAMCPIQVASNIRRKRHFGEIRNDAVTSSVSLVSEKDADAPTKENLQDPNISSLTTQASEDIALNLVSGCSSMADKAKSIKDDTIVMTPVQSQVLDVKLRLRQIEMEMVKLRKKQAEMKKEEKSRSSFGEVRNAEETIEARTVLVTNVHFAATKEALVSYFKKCGSISNVVILTDLVTAQPKGFAYITFTSEDSVGKSLELSGTSFFSRTVKVLRKAEGAAVISAQGQVARKPAQVQYYINGKAVLESPHNSNSHLQWRRESVSVPCETSDSTTTEEKSVAAPASM